MDFAPAAEEEEAALETDQEEEEEEHEDIILYALLSDGVDADDGVSGATLERNNIHLL